ncbi:MAG: methyltransferase domain-containing protein [Kofleriaceae bacterium]
MLVQADRIVVTFLAATVGVALAGCCGGAPPAQAPTPPAAADGSAATSHDHAGHAGPHHAHGGAGAADGTMVHRFDDVDRWVQAFDDPARDGWQHPDEVVALTAITPGMTVVDLGAGTGYFTGRLAAAVGASGKVIATDVEPNMVEHLRARFASEPVVEPRLTTPTDAGLPPASVDRILVVDVWHHIGDRGPFARQLAAALRPGGKLVIVDFTMASPRGPHPKHRIEPDALIAELAAAGLTGQVVAESLPNEYVVVAERAP